MVTVIIVAALLAAVWVGVKAGGSAICPHCGYVPRGLTAKVMPACQKCGRQKRL